MHEGFQVVRACPITFIEMTLTAGVIGVSGQVLPRIEVRASWIQTTVVDL